MSICHSNEEETWVWKMMLTWTNWRRICKERKRGWRSWRRRWRRRWSRSRRTLGQDGKDADEFNLLACISSWRLSLWSSCLIFFTFFLFGGKLWGKMAKMLTCVWPRCICSQASFLNVFICSLFTIYSLHVSAWMLIKSFKQKHWKVPQVIMASV